MFKNVLVIAILMVMAGTSTGFASKASVDSVLDLKMVTIEGDTVNLDIYSGKVILMVNVASKCGLTPQYEGLQELYQTYKERGFVILGFPANNFANQEPGTDQEIKQFCTTTFGVTFPMFSKLSVKGEDMHPLYHYLTSQATNGEFAGEISWNFTKFLIGKDGTVIDRFAPKTKPKDPKVIQAIEKAL